MKSFTTCLRISCGAFGQELIIFGQSVIFEKGLWRRSERDEKRREAKELGVDIELHYLDVPLNELTRRFTGTRA